MTHPANPLSASEPWNLVADGYAETTMFGALRAIKPDLPQPQRSVTTLENPERFNQEMEEAGFRNIEIRSVTRSLPRQISYPALARGVDGCKAQRAANGHSIGERCNAADAAPRTNPKGHSPAGALRRCGLLVENSRERTSPHPLHSRPQVRLGRTLTLQRFTMYPVYDDDRTQSTGVEMFSKLEQSGTDHDL